jgi:hypothetical protein
MPGMTVPMEMFTRPIAVVALGKVTARRTVATVSGVKTDFLIVQ